MSDALRDAWISEMWAPCREVPREERAVERALSRAEITLSDGPMWKDGASKTAPGTVVGATAAIPGPPPTSPEVAAMFARQTVLRIEPRR